MGYNDFKGVPRRSYGTYLLVATNMYIRSARLRVLTRPDGLYEIQKIDKTVGKVRVVKCLWPTILSRYALLCLVDDLTELEGVGYRYRSDVFYIDMD